jgi:hypothetical protein
VPAGGQESFSGLAVVVFLPLYFNPYEEHSFEPVKVEWITDSVSPALSTVGQSNFLGAYLAIVAPFILFAMLAAEERGRDPTA